MAEIAWVVGVRHQRSGYATMATSLVVAQLVANGSQSFLCHIKPGHIASNRVAQKMGFTETDLMEDGEKVWRMNMASEYIDLPDMTTKVNKTPHTNEDQPLARLFLVGEL